MLTDGLRHCYGAKYGTEAPEGFRQHLEDLKDPEFREALGEMLAETLPITPFRALPPC